MYSRILCLGFSLGGSSGGAPSLLSHHHRKAMAFRLTTGLELGPGDIKYDFLDNIRRILTTTPRGGLILADMAAFADEAAGPSSPSLAGEIATYLFHHFPVFRQCRLPRRTYGRTECPATWLAKPIEEKKKERVTVQIAESIFDTWICSLKDRHEVHILGVILTITVLHELVHVIRQVFCTTLTLENLRGSRRSAPADVLDLVQGQTNQVQRGEAGWEWQRRALGEMEVAFEPGAAGDWTRVSAVGFTLNNKTQWVNKTETQVMETLMTLHLYTLKHEFKYEAVADQLPFSAFGDVWRHGGATISPSSSRGAGQLLAFPYTRLPEAEAKKRLEQVTGMKVEIEKRICGTGMTF